MSNVRALEEFSYKFLTEDRRVGVPFTRMLL